MPLRFDTRKAAEEGDEFSYIARVVTFQEADLTPEERTAYNAEEGTDQYQLLIGLEGVSVEWVGDEGNLRTFWAKRTQPNGEPKKGRNNKGYHILKSVIAPADPDEAEADGFVDKSGHPEPGLGYDDAAPDFPNCLEGKIVRVAHRWVTFGKDETGEPIRSMIPALIEEFPDDYVHEGKVTKITYKGRKTTTREAGEPTGGTAEPEEAVEVEPADPADFFAALDGAKLHLQSLHEVMKDNPRLQVEPYRTLYASKAGRKALLDSACISVDDETPPNITVEEALDLAALVVLSKTAQRAAKK